MSIRTLMISRSTGMETISVALFAGADESDISGAMRELDRVAPIVEGLCPYCRTNVGALHDRSCVMALPDPTNLETRGWPA